MRTLPPKRATENFGLEFESDPKTNAAEAAILERRVSKTGELLLQARIIEKGIDSAKVRVVEDIVHRHVPHDIQPLFYFNAFVQREVASVRSGVAQAVACNIAEGRIEHCGCDRSVSDEPHVLVCHRGTDCVAFVDGIQAD